MVLGHVATSYDTPNTYLWVGKHLTNPISLIHAHGTENHLNFIHKILGILISLRPVVDWRIHSSEVPLSSSHGAGMWVLPGSTLSSGLGCDTQCLSSGWLGPSELVLLLLLHPSMQLGWQALPLQQLGLEEELGRLQQLLFRLYCLCFSLCLFYTCLQEKEVRH